MRNYRNSYLNPSSSKKLNENIADEASRTEFSKSLIVPPRTKKSNSNNKSVINSRRVSELGQTPLQSTNQKTQEKSASFMHIHDQSSAYAPHSTDAKKDLYYEEKYSSYDSRDEIEQALESLKKTQRESPVLDLHPQSMINCSPSFLMSKAERTPKKEENSADSSDLIEGRSSEKHFPGHETPEIEQNFSYESNSVYDYVNQSYEKC